MSIVKQNKFIFFACLAAVLFFTYIGWRNLDPDFGWHFQMGKIITTSGIPKTDPFTFTMPSYPFVDYEWGSNIFMYEIYSHFGKVLLSFFYALIATAAVLVTIPDKKRHESTFLLLLGLSAITPFVGIRPQVVSWLLFAILVRVLFDKVLWKKWRFGFPLLMLVWTTLHGSYPIAFVLVGVFKFAEFLQKKKIDIKDVLVVLLGAAATLINPYGINNWLEVLKQMAQTGLFRRTISEWQPFYTFGDLGFLFAMALSICLVWKYKRKIPLSFILPAILTGFMAVTSIRHTPIFILTIIPTLFLCLQLITNEATAVPLGKKRIILLWTIFSAIAAAIFVANFTFQAHRGYREDTMLPVDAIAYIKENNLSGNMFNIYSWGGYLIWKLPEKKVFVDGRMSGFVWKAPQGESDSAFLDYLAIQAGSDGWYDLFQKYNMTYALLNIEDKTKDTDLGFLLKKWLIGWGGNTYDAKISIENRLLGLGWKEVYRDKISVILKSP